MAKKKNCVDCGACSNSCAEAVVPAEETTTVDYGYYSRVLNKPFDSLNELAIAEAAYYAELKAKEDKAAQKKAEAENATDEDKANAPKEEAVKAAQKAQIVAQREAFTKQKEYFKKKYGKEAYDTVRMM